MKKFFYEKNRYIIDHEINKTFDEILAMSDEEFRQWCIDVRHIVVYCWDILGIPPRVGYDESDIIEQFQSMESFPVNKFLVKDELTGEKDVIRNTQILGNAVNQWFPTMMKVRINYTEEDKGRSVYDFFACDDLLDRFITYAKRHFQRDSFYAFSRPVQEMVMSEWAELPICATGEDWMYFFERYCRQRNEYDFWLQPIKDKEYTGYNEDIKTRKFLEYKGNYIRVYKKGQKIFPMGFKFWRVSFNQYAHNFPPLTAKYIYDNYLPDGPSVVWDPSMGWGGRLLGALGAKDTKQITYLGNDPNEDHTLHYSQDTYSIWTKYNDIHEFYCDNVNKGGLFPVEHNILKFAQRGSEEMKDVYFFKEYKGKVDLVFTSPPYFNREAYSEDETQSYKKFGDYESWKTGFLFETLKTAYEWLKLGGYIIWNIADLKIGKEYLPLEKDSCDIMEGFGMKFVKKLKMSLGQMPGGNRVQDGKMTAKNSCKVSGLWMKFEPLYIYQK